jgi:ankyrin repeat protein
VNQVIQASVPLPIPSALNLPMGSSLDINAQTRTGLTPLMAAAKAGQAHMVTTLLELGADAWRGDNSGVCQQ